MSEQNLPLDRREDEHAVQTLQRIRKDVTAPELSTVLMYGNQGGEDTLRKATVRHSCEQLLALRLMFGTTLPLKKSSRMLRASLYTCGGRGREVHASLSNA